MMTDPPQGGDGAPALAALAVRVDGLRCRFDTLATRLDTLTAAQQDQATALEGIAELRDSVEQILAIVGKQDESSPAEWFWLTMADQKRGERLNELSDWVDTVLHTQYPGYLTGQIKPCWPNHLEARWELAWLYQLWTLTYLTDRSAPKDAADWHDRWLPGVLRRLSQIMRSCEEACQRQPSMQGTVGISATPSSARRDSL